MMARWIRLLAAVAMLTASSAAVMTCPASAAELVHADTVSSDVTATDAAWWARQVDGTPFKPARRGKEWWRVVVAQNPSCGALTNGCQTCFPGEDSFRCSNPGFACVANEKWTCAVSARVAGK